MNILLVEDDAGLVELITTNLEQLGFSIMSAASGAEALAHLKKQTPDLLLLDYSLPDINGKELIETLNKQQTPPPPFIITTGQGDERIAVAMMKLGAMDYLIKDRLFLEKLPNVVQRVIKEIESDGKLKQAEEALKESEERIRLFTQNVPDYLLQIDSTGKINYINKTFEGLTHKDVIGTSIYAWIPKESTEKFKDKVEKVFRYGGNEIIEYPSKGAKGEPIWFESQIGPFEKSGIITQVIIVARDITERKQAEEKIRVAEENLKNTFDLSPSIICKANVATGYFTEGNIAVTRILGYSLEEFTSKPIVEFVHLDDRQRTIDEMSELLGGKEMTFFENRYLCKGGSYKWMSWNGTKADKHGIVTAIASDITKRKKAQRSVRRLSTAVEQSPSIIVIADTEGIVEYVNPTFTELTGYSSTEAIGQKSNILKSGKQDTLFYKELWKTVRSGKVWRGQFHNKKKNGELFWEAASISSILNDSGNIINFIKIGEDITHQKSIEADLKIALDKALESDRLKSAFLSNMSHEIRTPMNGILGFIDLLNEPNLSKSKIGQYSAIINKSGQRLLNTINDIIDFSKIEAGEVVIVTAETYINNEIEELHSFFLPEANLKGLSLIIEPSLSAEQLMVITDSHKLHGILANLIKNALKYTEKGTITFGYLLKDDFIEFFVEDTGIGIPKDRLQAIFNRFEQADIEDVKVLEGSGLGLAISKAYVTMLGGEISVESVVEKGSKFVFTIPYVKKTGKEVVALVENIAADHKEINKLNLLIVEDDDVSSDFLEMLLEDTFPNITFAQNGKVAVEICRNNLEIDLVLMDLKMPVMDGYTATQQIRKFNKDLLIIAQTAYAMQGDREKAIEAGCNDYISKPINKILLFEIINRLLDGSVASV